MAWLLVTSACQGPLPPALSPVVDPPPNPIAPAPLAAEPLTEDAATAPPAAPPSARPGAGGTPSPPRLPELIRVGLATDRDEVVLPCCAAWELVGSAGPAVRVTPGRAGVRVRPALGQGATMVYRIQVAALRDERQARLSVERLRAAGVAQASAVFDAERSLYRVRGGGFAAREAADAALRGEPFRTYPQAHVVKEGASLAAPAFLVLLAEPRLVTGRELRVLPASAPFDFESGRYRGHLLLFLNERGRINVVDELPLEDYLRGVLPREMGPELYPEIDALKALAVAARTYAVHNLGQFASEGFDICATPRCQAYGGVAAEHVRSDRAVAETAGQVLLHRGRPIDALYTASCGGRTDEQPAVFPDKPAEPYLRAVTCPEAGLLRLTPRAAAERTLVQDLARRLEIETGAATPQQVERRLRRLAALAGLPAPAAVLRSLDGAELARYLRLAFDLRLERTALQASADGELRWLSERPGAVTRRQLDRLTLELVRRLELVAWRRVALLGARDGVLELRDGRDHLALPLDPNLHVLVPRAGELVPATLDLAPGQPIEVVVDAGRVLAVIGHAAVAVPAAPRQWTRFRSDAELLRLVGARYPGFAPQTLEVLERSAAGRVSRVRLLGAKEQLELTGLDIRFTLDLPENQFSVARHRTSDGRTGYLFRGRGQGHGIGLCQVGSHELAEQGRDYREILHHYYAGVVLAKLAVARAGDAAAGSPSR